MMCGIAGIFYHDLTKTPNSEELEASAESLHHRGPDARGVYSGRGIGLSHTRLSLVDLNPRSNQPFWDDTQRYCLVFNGEIYNFRALRSHLEQRSVAFNTTGDTEVLLQCLINHKPELIIPRLEGMFAFAFYDTVEGLLILARDRFGMKPLYVYEDERAFLFASEVKALRSWITPEVDPYSISSYLLGFGGPTKGFTFYKGVTSMPPGSMIAVRRGKSSHRSQFFSMPDFWDVEEMEALSRLKPMQLVDKMDALLLASVKNHMFADSEVGAYCSGGVDSSLLMAMAARIHDNLAIFHANVKGAWSEYPAALRLSQHLKLELKSVDVHEQDFIDRLPDVMAHYEHPYTYHPNSAPFLMVSMLANEHNVKGLLSGEGSDECFLGYPWLGRQRLVNAYYRGIDALRSLVRRIPQIGKILWPSQGNDREVAMALMNRCEVADDEQNTRTTVARLGESTIHTGNVWTVEYLNYHLRTLLHRNDALGMAASIEARFPFLDHEVVMLAVNLPFRCKLRLSPTVFEKAHPFVRDKWIVRKVADRYIPRSLSQRIKIGFWTTVFQRMRVAPAYFKDSFIRERFELSVPQMEHVVSQADQAFTMRLLHLDIWEHVCLHRLSLESSRNKLTQFVDLVPE